MCFYVPVYLRVYVWKRLSEQACVMANGKAVHGV